MHKPNEVFLTFLKPALSNQQLNQQGCPSGQPSSKIRIAQVPKATEGGRAQRSTGFNLCSLQQQRRKKKILARFFRAVTSTKTQQTVGNGAHKARDLPRTHFLKTLHRRQTTRNPSISPAISSHKRGDERHCLTATASLLYW